MAQNQEDKHASWRKQSTKELEGLEFRRSIDTDPVKASVIREELRYRQQKRIATWVAWLVGGTLLTNIVGIVVNAFINLRQ